jgi:hypothetical protein
MGHDYYTITQINFIYLSNDKLEMIKFDYKNEDIRSDFTLYNTLNNNIDDNIISDYEDFELLLELSKEICNNLLKENNDWISKDATMNNMFTIIKKTIIKRRNNIGKGEIGY